MSGRSVNAIVAQGSAAVVWAGAFAGSAAELTHIGVGAGMALPLSLPVSLDLVAVTAAARLACDRSDRLARWTLRAFTLVSLVLQVATTPWTGQLVPDVCHALARGAVVAGSLVAAELALRPAPGGAESPAEAHESPGDARPAPPAPVPALRAVDDVLEPLVPMARALLAEFTRRGHVEVGGRKLAAALAAADRPVSPEQAERLLGMVG